MTEPRPEDDETRPIDRQDPVGDKAAEHTAPMDPFTDDDGMGPRHGDETVIQDATQVIPPSEEPATRPAWAGRAGVPVPPPPRDAAPYPTGEPAQPRTWWTPILLGLLALGLLGVIILVAWLMNRDDTPKPAVTSTPTLGVITATPSLVPTTAAPSPTASPTAQLVQVPSLVGMTQDKAAAELTKLGLAYAFEFKDSTAPQDQVIATRPGPAELVPAGSTVTLVISKGGVASPSPSVSASPSPQAN
ncbi:hypothetical protein Rhe02_39660 [Rhizocola hellebori]|uniref:PASTA domain-containing protein n=1 Tax=Rhizocola hellebori TaxID=1392758 RepID=A0A8J3Q9F9_9ACTN|nr:PASTA domain-containing protein [Rhizocola hellebori]GIH05899.1 hypothetical protein Rhe02_39660 [Rhizocola hellebori]